MFTRERCIVNKCWCYAHDTRDAVLATLVLASYCEPGSHVHSSFDIIDNYIHLFIKCVYSIQIFQLTVLLISNERTKDILHRSFLLHPGYG